MRLGGSTPPVLDLNSASFWFMSTFWGATTLGAGKSMDFWRGVWECPGLPAGPGGVRILLGTCSGEAVPDRLCMVPGTV